MADRCASAQAGRRRRVRAVRRLQARAGARRAARGAAIGRDGAARPHRQGHPHRAARRDDLAVHAAGSGSAPAFGVHRALDTDRRDARPAASPSRLLAAGAAARYDARVPGQLLRRRWSASACSCCSCDDRAARRRRAGAGAGRLAARRPPRAGPRCPALPRACSIGGGRARAWRPLSDGFLYLRSAGPARLRRRAASRCCSSAPRSCTCCWPCRSGGWPTASGAGASSSAATRLLLGVYACCCWPSRRLASARSPLVAGPARRLLRRHRRRADGTRPAPLVPDALRGSGAGAARHDHEPRRGCWSSRALRRRCGCRWRHRRARSGCFAVALRSSALRGAAAALMLGRDAGARCRRDWRPVHRAPRGRSRWLVLPRVPARRGRSARVAAAAARRVGRGRGESAPDGNRSATLPVRSTPGLAVPEPRRGRPGREDGGGGAAGRPERHAATSTGPALRPGATSPGAGGLCLASRRRLPRPVESTRWSSARDFPRHATRIPPRRACPSRTRVFPDGRYGAATVFVTGHSYSDEAASRRNTTLVRHERAGPPLAEPGGLHDPCATGQPVHTRRTSTSGG